MVQEAEKPIFKDGVFAIVISKDLPRIQAEEVCTCSRCAPFANAPPIVTRHSGEAWR